MTTWRAAGRRARHRHEYNLTAPPVAAGGIVSVGGGGQALRGQGDRRQASEAHQVTSEPWHVSASSMTHCWCADVAVGHLAARPSLCRLSSSPGSVILRWWGGWAGRSGRPVSSKSSVSARQPTGHGGSDMSRYGLVNPILLGSMSLTAQVRRAAGPGLPEIGPAGARTGQKCATTA